MTTTSTVTGRRSAVRISHIGQRTPAEGCAAAAFANTGQMCIHIERVLVDESVYDEFRSTLVEATQALSVGQTFDYSVDVGSLASDVDWSPDGDVLAISGKDGDGAFVRLVDRSGSTIEALALARRREGQSPLIFGHREATPPGRNNMITMKSAPRK